MNPEILAILACPKCTGSLHITAQNDGLTCPACHLVYPIIESVPLLLPEEGIAEQDWGQGTRSKKDTKKAPLITPDNEQLTE